MNNMYFLSTGGTIALNTLTGAAGSLITLTVKGPCEIVLWADLLTSTTGKVFFTVTQSAAAAPTVAAAYGIVGSALPIRLGTGTWYLNFLSTNAAGSTTAGSTLDYIHYMISRL